ncbi:MAG TPA: ATP-binding protein [Rhizomicrobium sp.]|jgi:two-component system cell cycle sensor histidine kinase/response regulator CckA
MNAGPSNTRGNFGLAPGAWRWAALGFALLAVAAAVPAVVYPHSAGWTGIILVAGIGAVACLVLFAVWPRQTLSASEARRIAEAASHANVAWVVTGADGAVLDCNDAYCQLANVKPGEAAPPPVLMLTGDASSPTLYRLARAAAEGQPREEALTVGPGVELTAAVRPLRDKQTAWWFAPRPAEPQSAAPADAGSERAAGKTQQAGLSALRDAPVGVAMADAAGKIIEANPCFTEFFGAAQGRQFSDLIADGHRAAAAQLIARAIENGAAHQSVELRPLVHADRMAELFASPAGGGTAILYLIDVSEQKALETKFAQSQKMQAVGQLAGGVAHDFNNLLTVIIGNSDMLLMRHHAGDPSFREINEIRQTALRAANLITQLLAFSRQQTLQPRPLNLRDAFGDLAQLLRRLVGEGIKVELDQAADLWLVYADGQQISNAIINLVVNARDAMPKGGSITIATANETFASDSAFGTAIMPAGDYVRIEVADTGSGIAPEHLGKIFDPFFTTKDVGQGTGLGLATVYGIVKQTGGYITVDSETGKGAAFRIYLPRYRGDAAPVEAERPALRDITGQDTILLVEDEAPVRSFAARALTMRGYSVLEAPGGEEALEIVRNHTGTIHLVVTDVMMPGMDGPTMVRAVRRLRPEVQVIFMSGYAEEVFRKNDENASDLHFLPKPFGIKQLAAKVKDVLSTVKS